WWVARRAEHSMSRVSSCWDKPRTRPGCIIARIEAGSICQRRVTIRSSPGMVQCRHRADRLLPADDARRSPSGVPPAENYVVKITGLSRLGPRGRENSDAPTRRANERRPLLQEVLHMLLTMESKCRCSSSQDDMVLTRRL